STMFLSENGDIYSVGIDSYGVLGLGGIGNQKVPKKIEFNFLSKPVSIHGNNYQVAVLCEDGEMYTWGMGRHGLLAHGNVSDSNIPKLVNWFTDRSLIVERIMFLWENILILTSDDILYVVGSRDKGLAGDGGSLTGTMNSPTVLFTDFSTKYKDIRTTAYSAVFTTHDNKYFCLGYSYKTYRDNSLGNTAEKINTITEIKTAPNGEGIKNIEINHRFALYVTTTNKIIVCGALDVKGVDMKSWADGQSITWNRDVTDFVAFDTKGEIDIEVIQTGTGDGETYILKDNIGKKFYKYGHNHSGFSGVGNDIYIGWTKSKMLIAHDHTKPARTKGKVIKIISDYGHNNNGGGWMMLTDEGELINIGRTI
ncbi:MAG: hypothetical protein ACRC5T_13375, partial [Cetobacterium sp.]